MATLAAKLLALYELHKRGLLTDDEFARAKAREIATADQVPVRLSAYLDDVDRQLQRISTLITVLSAVLTFLVLLIVFWLWGMVS